MKKLLSLVLSLFIVCTTCVNALEHGAYGVSVTTSYWNFDTGEIDDGGTANAALGDGMSRSCTSNTALIEKDGDKYYVTMRLLLQSDTNNVSFWQRTGFNTYSSVKYEIIAENAVADSVDYRFEVTNPFNPIKISMYVVPMGRDVIWYAQLSESSTSSNTGDFIVNVKPQEEITPETEPEVAQPETDQEQATDGLDEEVTSDNQELVEQDLAEQPTIEQNLTDEQPDLEEPQDLTEEDLAEEDLAEEELAEEELAEEELVEQPPIEQELQDNKSDDELIEEQLTQNEPAIEASQSNDIPQQTQDNEQKSYAIYYVIGALFAILGIGFYYKNKKGK